VARFVLDTNAASRLLVGERTAITSMRRAGATNVSISSVTESEMLYGALLARRSELMAKVRKFLARVEIHAWDSNAAEALALLRAEMRARKRSLETFDVMIAAHAMALGATLVTSDKAIARLGAGQLTVVEW
jgi:tRNA(fMet)-specific endonuclease VapC